MCGIAGIIGKRGSNVGLSHHDSVSQMIRELNHRGPDAVGFSRSNSHSFGHARLSIIDLSTLANQPMKSDGGRFEIVFNGEIYNYLELKGDLLKKGYSFSTNGDTEVILRLWEEYGQLCLEMLNGMFAFALYDYQEAVYYLARDRFGVKPLYITIDSNEYLHFCSEINPIISCSSERKLNYQGLSEYLHFGSPQGAETMFEGVVQIEPGSVVAMSRHGQSTRQYYNLSSPLNQKSLDKEDLLESLQNAVSIQNRADVETGVLLSGGIDSSAIACLLHRSGQRNINTFTAAFEFGGVNDERKLARMVSERIGSKHSEIYIKSADALELIDQVIDSFGQPFADPAALPLLKLYEEISGHVKVILQGDGGDELFGGYDRYVRGGLANRALSLIPLVNDSMLNFLSRRRYINSNLIRNLRALSQIDNSKFVASYMDQDIPGFPIENCLSTDTARACSGVVAYKKYVDVVDANCNDLSQASCLMHADRQIILPSIYLPKVDRTSMPHSIEARVPFLDNDLYSLVSSMSITSLTAGGVTKSLLRETLQGLVPAEILNSKKKGFGVPIGEWMKRELGSLLQELAPSCPLLNHERVSWQLVQHRKGTADLGLGLYKLLILCCWYRKFQKKLKL